MADEAVDELAVKTLLDCATFPLTEEQARRVVQQTDHAYRVLAMSPDFRFVLQRWIRDVLLAPCEDQIAEGRRRFLIGLIVDMVKAQQRGMLEVRRS